MIALFTLFASRRPQPPEPPKPGPRGAAAPNQGAGRTPPQAQPTARAAPNQQTGAQRTRPPTGPGPRKGPTPKRPGTEESTDRKKSESAGAGGPAPTGREPAGREGTRPATKRERGAADASPQQPHPRHESQPPRTEDETAEDGSAGSGQSRLCRHPQPDPPRGFAGGLWPMPRTGLRMAKSGGSEWRA